MFCEKCGKQNADKAGFCSGCGASLREVIPGQAGRRSRSMAPPVQPIVRQPVQAAPVKQRSMAPLFITLSVVTTLALAGGGIALGVHLSNEQKAQRAAAQKAEEEALKEALDEANDGAEALFADAAMALVQISYLECEVEDGCYIVEDMDSLPDALTEGDVTPSDPELLLYYMAQSCEELSDYDGLAVCIEDGKVTGALCKIEDSVGSYPCDADLEDAEDFALDEDTLEVAASKQENLGGYVDKSRVLSMNSNAKSLYNCTATALVELDSEGVDISQFDGVHVYGDCSTMDEKMYNYFNALEDSEYLFMYIVEDGWVTAAWVTDGRYAGGYPNGSSVDNGTPASFTVWDARG